MYATYAVVSISGVGSLHGYVGTISSYVDAICHPGWRTPQRLVFDKLTLPAHNRPSFELASPQALEMKVGQHTHVDQTGMMHYA
jgi:hypothetical protein